MLQHLLPSDPLEAKIVFSQFLLNILLYFVDPELWVTIAITIYTIVDGLFF